MKNLDFLCCTCGRCCQGAGGVYLNQAGVLEISRFLGISSPECVSQYLENLPKGLYGLKTKNDPQYPHGDQTPVCVFLEAGKCRIHPVKPLICKAWPFLYGPLKSQDSFLEAKASCCGLKDWDYPSFLWAFAAQNKDFPPPSYRTFLER
ncbi:MAG: YkgJ family cysteine cluster protein [Deltaproteobacteria bacterium]|jgi:Fe-S-cluster containining protein|nr:YkgJ family cysteine cluster protein [Deltaproteobacteria bacterium]